MSELDHAFCANCNCERAVDIDLAWDTWNRGSFRLSYVVKCLVCYYTIADGVDTVDTTGNY